MNLGLDQKLKKNQINGIQNNSNWCFVNSAIHILYSIDLIRNYILNLDLENPSLKIKKYYETYVSLKYIFNKFISGNNYLSDNDILEQKKNIVKGFTLDPGTKSQVVFHQGETYICFGDALFLINTLLYRLSDINFFKEKFKIGRLYYIQFLNGNNTFLNYYETVNFLNIKEKLTRDTVPTFRAIELHNTINENTYFDAIQKMAEKKYSIEQHLGNERGKDRIDGSKFFFDLDAKDTNNIQLFNSLDNQSYHGNKNSEEYDVETSHFSIDYSYSEIFYDDNKNIEFVFLDRTPDYIRFEEEQIFFNKKYKLKSILINENNSHFYIKVKIDNIWYVINNDTFKESKITDNDYVLWYLCVYEIDKKQFNFDNMIKLINYSLISKNVFFLKNY